MIGAAESAEQAVALAVARLPAGLGPAVAGPDDRCETNTSTSTHRERVLPGQTVHPSSHTGADRHAYCV
ncbi:DUF6193 family natural product biosynthesis protein [Streptomyces sp. NPDC012693]|uniref:DUF6193 family natural product biosynthesis protein n=1 Tax=Streptomyces sp. NPDC012693 TaxID=3364844 RepID=UPI0036C806E1